MEPRIEYGTAAPGAMKAMGGIEAYARHSGLEASLLELVRLRASQINGWNRLAIAFRTAPGTYQPATNRGESRSSLEIAPANREA